MMFCVRYRGSITSVLIASLSLLAQVACNSAVVSATDIPAQSTPQVIQSATDSSANPRADPSPSALLSLGSLPVPGYVLGLHVSGDFVYLPYGDGVHIVDVSTPTNPKMAGNAVSERVQSVFVSGTNAFLAGRKFEVFDISDQTRPTHIGSLSSFNRQIGGIFISGNYAYVLTPRILTIVDISDGKNPRVCGKADIPASETGGIFVSGQYAYVAASTDGLLIIDVSDAMQPHMIGAAKIPGAAVAVQVKGMFAYIAGHSGGLVAVNVSDPTKPFEVGRVALGAPVRAVSVSGTRAYVAAYNEGMKVVDITDPSSMRLVSGIKTEGFAENVQVIGDVAYVVGQLDPRASKLQAISVDNK